jgi:hypothetical protein
MPLWRPSGSEARELWQSDMASLWGCWLPESAYGEVLGKEGGWAKAAHLKVPITKIRHPGSQMHSMLYNIMNPKVSVESSKACDIILWKGQSTDANLYGQDQSQQALPKVRRHTQSGKNSSEWPILFFTRPINLLWVWQQKMLIRIVLLDSMFEYMNCLSSLKICFTTITIKISLCLSRS